MDIILLKDIEKLGYKHDIVDVKNGYGRNFLIPQGLGVIANDANRKKLDVILADIEAQESARLEEYKEMSSKLEGQKVKVGVKAGTSGKIFGSVTNIQVAQALKDQLEIDIARKKIILPDNVKELGTYTATLELHKEVTSSIEFELVQE